MTTVGYLFFWSRPTTVFGRVGAVVVNPIDRMIWRRFSSHIRKEVRKIIPTWTDFNSASSVVWIVAAIRVIASLTKGSPSYPFRRIMRFTMFVIGSTKSIFCPASAGRAMAFKISGVNSALGSTITTTKPHCSFVVNARKGQDSPSIETLTCKVDHWVCHLHLCIMEGA